MEEYLEVIYRLQERYGVAKTGDLVDMLGVSPGTVTNTIERLEKMLLVIREPYKGVQLTEKGKKIALNIIRRHRLLERLLFDILGVEWCKVHELACNLEHWINDYVAKKIENILGFPKKCPHGNPIPTEDGKIFEEVEHPLFEVNVGERAKISRILKEEGATLSYLEGIGVEPEKIIEVMEKSPLNDLIIIKVNGGVRTLSREVASLIMVRKT
ncbi:MAG: metal-dependent transcriptional regulator [Candidatus Bathyarchaeia archaeon]